MAKTSITIDTLAEMINEGFKTTATKEDLKEVKQDVAMLRSEMKTGFDRIEHLLLEEQERRDGESGNADEENFEDALAL